MSQRWSFARPDEHSLALNSAMNAPMRPVEHGLSSASIPLAQHNPEVTGISDLPPNDYLTRSSNTSDAFRRPSSRQQQTPLVDWYTSHGGPWDPIHGRGRNVLRVGGKLGYRPIESSYSSYRNNDASPSESETTAHGTLASDSGYGSLTRLSVDDGSLYGDCDRSGDTASVSSRLTGFHFDRPMISPEVWRQPATIHNERPVSVDVNKLICLYCKAKVKTKSELKKHEQKHTKPYHCEARDCSRSEGFSTPNDVVRHMRSCHPELSSKGNSYKCNVANCRSKDKKWPRADNFRQHLKRVHRIAPVDDDLKEYIYKPPQGSPSPELAGLGTSIGDGLMSLSVGHDALSSSSWAFSVQSVQKQNPGDPCELNNYMDQQMDFQRSVAIAQQHITMMSRTEDHVPNDLMQISPLEIESDRCSISREQANPQVEGLQGLSPSSIDNQETNYEEPNFFNEATIPNDESEDEQSIIYHVSEPDLATNEQLCEKPKHLDQPSIRDFAEPATDRAYHAAPDDANAMDETESLCSTSTTTASTSSGGDDVLHPALAVHTPSESQGTESKFNISDVIKDQDKAYDLIKALKDQGLLPGLLEKVEYQGPGEIDVPPDADGPNQVNLNKNAHVCSEENCKKSFSRLCELKKHSKRHVRPYGCTFSSCDKRFGSKNDWKRHENTQHCKFELWKCNAQSKSSTGELCNKTYNRREQFKTHLSKEHGLSDPVRVAEKIKECFDGRKYHVRFWCGFCKKMVEVEASGLEAWLGRFNHIDSHFSSSLGISEWTPEVGMPVDVIITLSDKACPGGPSDTAATLPSRAGDGEQTRISKRGAVEDAPQHRPSKKARPSAVIYCCGCGCQHLTAFSSTCLTASCMGHEPCGNCRADYIPVGTDEDGV